MNSEFEQIVNDFEFLEDWEDKYRYVIEEGKKMPALDEALKVDSNKVNGCASQVWLHFSISDTLYFDGDSDAGKLLVKATMGEVELFARPKSWNAVLWLIANTLKLDGKPVYTGDQLGELKSSLPIAWRAE